MNTELYKKLREHIQNNPTSIVFARLAELLFEGGKQDTAITLIEKGMEQNPSYLTGYLVMGHLFQRSGKYDRAKEAYTNALKFDPFNIAALYGLAQMEISSGNYPAATAHILQILSIDPINRTAYSTLVQNWEKIEEAVPELTKEPEEELPSVDVEKIGGGVFSLIGIESIQEIKHLPLVIKAMPEELEALEQMSESKQMEPVELNEIEQESDDLVEIDEIFKAFQAPVSKEQSAESVRETQLETVHQETETEEIELDWSEQEQSAESVVEQEPTTSAQQPAEQPSAPPEDEEILDWGLETGESEKNVPEVSEEISPGKEITALAKEEKLELSEGEFDWGEIEEEKTATEPEEIITEPEVREEIQTEKAEKKPESAESAEETFELSEDVFGLGEMEQEITEETESETTEKTIPSEEEIVLSGEQEKLEIAGEKIESIETEKEKLEIEVLKTEGEEESEVSEKVSGNEDIPSVAEIFAAQGDTEKAIEIYENLLAQTELGKQDREKYQNRLESLKKRLTESPPEIESSSQESSRESEPGAEMETSAETEEMELPEDVFQIGLEDSGEAAEKPIQKAETETEPEITKQTEKPAAEGEEIETEMELPEDVFQIDIEDSMVEISESVSESEPEAKPKQEVQPKPETEIKTPETEDIDEMLNLENVFEISDEEKEEQGKPMDEILKQPESEEDTGEEETEFSLDDLPEDVFGLGIGTTEESEEGISWETEQPAVSEEKTEPGEEETPEIEIEQIDGLQLRDDSGFQPPEETDDVGELSTRQDFTPPEPDETETEIEGLETRIDEPFATIPEELLEPLIKDEEPRKEEEPAPRKTPKDVNTATTAEIYAAQGKTEKAIEIYEKVLARTDISKHDREIYQNRLELLKKRLKES